MPTATLDDERLNRTFAALAHPTRRAILTRLAEGEASVGELAEPFAMSMPAISRHIRVLEQAGLVQQGRRAQYRPCTLDTSPLAEVADAQLPEAQPVNAAYLDNFRANTDVYLSMLRLMDRSLAENSQ